MNGELGPPARPEEPTQVGGLVPLLTATVPIPTEQVLAADPTMADEPSLQQATELPVVDGLCRLVPEREPRRIACHLQEAQIHRVVAELHDRAQDASGTQQPCRLALEPTCFAGIETIDESITEEVAEGALLLRRRWFEDVPPGYADRFR